MKVKFIEDYGNYHRGMQYPMEQVGKENAERLEKEGIARIFPLVEFDKPVEISEKPISQKSKKKG